MPTLANRIRTFWRREWPLFLSAVLALWAVVFFYDNAPQRIAGLIGLAGGLFCLKHFGLDHCPWIYLLAVVLMLPLYFAVDGARELLAIEPLWSWGELFAIQIIGAVMGMLIAIPFSLFFLRNMRGFSTIWKIPLSIFFLTLAVGPFFSVQGLLLFMSLVSCP